MISRLCWTLLPNAVMGQLHIWMLLYSEDLKITANGPTKFTALITAIFDLGDGRDSFLVAQGQRWP